MDLSNAKRRNLTAYDVLTIASMVEREAAARRASAPIVASVIYNRLSAGHPARDRRDDPLRDEQLDEPLTQSELAIDSPYNTRSAPGLPPGPIGNPGLASIQAAANPTKHGLPLLRREAREAASTRSRRREPSSSATSSATTRERTRRAASADRLLM